MLETWTRDRCRMLGLEWPGIAPRPRGVLVAVAGGQTSMDAALWARTLDAEIHVAHATGTDHEVPVIPAGFGPPGTPALENQRVDRVFAKTRGLLSPRTPTEHRLDGRATQAIPDLADDLRADLVMVGASPSSTDGPARTERLADILARDERFTTLIARRPPVQGPVVAAAGTDPASSYAAAWAARVADMADVPLILAHVAEQVPAPEGFADLGDDVEAVLMEFPVVKSIRDLAIDRRASLVVVGRSHASQIRGDVPLQLSRTLPTSVLVAKPWTVRAEA